MNKSAIVLARNYSTALSVIRGLGLAGYEIDLVITVRDKDADQAQIAACSKYVRHAHILTGRKYSDATDQKVVDCLNGYEGTHLLFPIDDYSVMMMDKHREEFSAHFIMPYIAGGGLHEMTRLMDKTVQSALARSVGMKVPKEWVLDLNSFAIPDDMVYPCFVKPLNSVLGYKTEMKRCEDARELAAHLAKLVERNRDRSILVQEFLEIDEEISMSGVCADQAVLLPALVAKSRIGKHETGVTLSGSLVPVETVGETTVQQIHALLKAFHYVGQFDMEVLRCGEEYYFGEVNLRSGGPNFAYTLNGVNLPAVAAKVIDAKTGQCTTCPKVEGCDSSHLFREAGEITFHKPFVYEKVAWEDYLNFRIGKKELNEILNETEDKLLNWAEDPAPGDLFDEIMKKLSVVERARSLGKKTPVYKGYLLAKDVKSSDLKKPLRKQHTISAQDILDGHTLKPKKNKRVILMSRNYSSLLGMIRALAGSEYEIEVIRLFQTPPKRHRVYLRMIPEGFSKYVNKYHICITNHDDMKLVNFIMGLYQEDIPTLLLPADDYPMSVLDTYYNTFEPYFKLPHAHMQAGRLNELMGKQLQKQMLKDFGFNVVDSHQVDILDHQYELPEGIHYPCFMKPAVSVTSSKKIMRRCESEEELRLALDGLAEKHEQLSVLVEDFLDIKKEYALLGLCADNQVMIPNGMVRMLRSGQGAHHGVTMIGKVIPTAPVQALMDQISDFMKTMHFTGLFDVDLLAADGKIYICEINLRFGASGYAITACGVNLPKMFADYMLGNIPLNQDAAITEFGKTFASEKVLIEDHGEHYITTDYVKEVMERVDIHLIADPEDPEPYEYMKKFYKFSWIMPIWRGAKKIIKRK